MTSPPARLPTADATGRLIDRAPELVTEPEFDTIADRAMVMTAPLPNNLLLRWPDPAKRAQERGLVEGHAVARRDAVAALAGWLPDLPIDELADHPGQQPPSVFDVDRSLSDDLDLLALADRLMAEHNMGSPKLIIATEGSPEHKAPPPTALGAPAGRFDHPHALAGPFAGLLAEGATVIIHAAHYHDPTLADLTEALSVALGTQVGANLYLSRAGALGFGPHWDDHDVLIVQGDGAKRWQVFEPLVPSPVRPVAPDGISETIAWEGTLSPGQALYVPRGWGHQVSGDDDLSIHATITLQRLRFDQIAGFAAGMSGFWPLFRADVPFDRDERVVSYTGSLYDEPGQFRAGVAQLGDASALEHGTAQWLAKLPQRRRGRLSTSVAAMRRTDWSDVVLQGSFPGGVAVVDEKADPRLVAGALDEAGAAAGVGADGATRPLVAAGGRLIELEEWALPALAKLLDGRPVRVADLPLDDAPGFVHAAGSDRRSLLAATLVGLGLVDVVGVG